jgi:septum formation protein
VLASGSPRRQELLRDAGYVFDVIPADVDEDTYPPSLKPGDVAEYLAFIKAQAVAQDHRDVVVLGADTVVTLGEQLIGKPRDAAHAREMLRLLSGTTHLVITGISVIHRARHLVKRSRVMSAVHMRGLRDAEIDAYVATGQWQGKAGGYGIQDRDPFVTRTSGCHTNIVGLPMTDTKRLLAEVGIEPSAQRR